MSDVARGELKWQQDENSLSLLNSDKVVWRFNAHLGEMKPCFHPLATLDGKPLTDYRPNDHPWHRGAWFSFKDINGVNYWEEDSTIEKSAGRTRVEKVVFLPGKDFSAQLELTLSYSPPGKTELMHEQRVITVSAPDQVGNYRIDWQMAFVAREDVSLRRTPLAGEPEGAGHGGYAGFSVRLDPHLRTGTVLNSEGQSGAKTHGAPASWISFSKPTGSISVFDHPGNHTFPTAVYVNTQMPFLSPAFLFYKGMDLKKSGKLNLSYRILVGGTVPTLPDLDAEFDSFKKVSFEINATGKINLVELGHQIYANLCEACHSTDPPGKDFKTGPTLWALSGIEPRARQVQTEGETKEIATDDAYLRRSILTPNLELAIQENGDQKGTAYLPIMPDYSQILRPQEVEAVIAYIKTLNPQSNRGSDEVWETDTQQKTKDNPNIISLGTEALVQRAIIKGESTRTFAVGMPNGYRYLFDPETGTVTKAWRGGFLDLSGERVARGAGPNQIDEPIYFGFKPFLKPLGIVKYRGYQLVKGGAPMILMEIDGNRIAQRISFENDQLTLKIERLGVPTGTGVTSKKSAVRFQLDRGQLTDLQVDDTKANGDQLTLQPAVGSLTLSTRFRKESELSSGMKKIQLSWAFSNGKEDKVSAGFTAAIDGKEDTYWDEVDSLSSYSLRIGLAQRETISSLRIRGYQQQNYAPKDFEILADGKLVKSVTNAIYKDNQLEVEIPPTEAGAIELRITGSYGASPAIREVELFTRIKP